jgi:tagatose 6-phosphate kinase
VILAVCLNAAVDVTYHVSDRVTAGGSYRVQSVRHRAGGKAVNVARVLGQLGEPGRLLAFAGGTNGEQFGADLQSAGLQHVLVAVAGDTRRTVTVVDTVEATTFNEPGPRVSEAEWAELLEVYVSLLPEAELVVLSGSLPPGVPVDAYRQLIALATPNDVRCVLDTDGAALSAALPARPWVVKPNHHELSELVGAPLPDVAALHSAARDLAGRGPVTVVVSRAADGVIAVGPDGSWQAQPPEQQAGNPTGAGDSLVAALAAGLVRGREWTEILADAVAVSAAAVPVAVAGEIHPPTMRRLRPAVVVRSLAHLSRES